MSDIESMIKSRLDEVGFRRWLHIYRNIQRIDYDILENQKTATKLCKKRNTETAKMIEFWKRREGKSK